MDPKNSTFKWFVKQNGVVVSKHKTYAAADKSLGKLVEAAHNKGVSSNADIFDQAGTRHSVYPRYDENLNGIGCSPACSCNREPCCTNCDTSMKKDTKTLYEKIEDGVYDAPGRGRGSVAYPLFLKDLCEENKISSEHPKAGLLFDIAWEMGHSSGLAEVANYFHTMSDLIK